MRTCRVTGAMTGFAMPLTANAFAANKGSMTVPAKLVPENSAFDQNAKIIHVESDGSRKLIAIRRSGKRFTLQVEPHNQTWLVPEERSRFLVEHFMVEIIAAWDPDVNDGQVHRQWARTLSENLAPHSLPGDYSNILGPDQHAQIAHA